MTRATITFVIPVRANIVPDDQWSVKKMAVTLRTPKDPRHPYSAVINFWAADAWSPGYQFTFDRKGQTVEDDRVGIQVQRDL